MWERMMLPNLSCAQSDHQGTMTVNRFGARIDYVMRRRKREGVIELAYAPASHSSYWDSEDVVLFCLMQICRPVRCTMYGDVRCTIYDVQCTMYDVRDGGCELIRAMFTALVLLLLLLCHHHHLLFFLLFFSFASAAAAVTNYFYISRS